MDFKDSILQLADRVSSLKESILTEEATKNAFIMPFIQILGYDVFNPLEVVPEMDCDITKKKGEKIDYAIMKDGSPIMLIECKHWKQDLNLHDNQLKRYYVASKAKFGVLTNGIVYRFYADLIKENIMDDVPFLDADLDMGTEARQGLIDGVVHDLIHQVVQARGRGGADIHARPLAHRFQPLQHLDLGGVVFLGDFFGKICHSSSKTCHRSALRG